MQSYCAEIAAHLFSRLNSGEFLSCWFQAEHSLFARFSRGSIRQIGKVLQVEVSLDLSQGNQHAAGSTVLGGTRVTDVPALDEFLTQLRQQREALPPDPYFMTPEEVRCSERIEPAGFDANAIVDDILAATGALDLAGILAAGPQYFGYADSRGQHNWHERSTCHFDFSGYTPAGAAVKNSLAGQTWDRAAFLRLIADTQARLAVADRPQRILKPGHYRSYLAPGAVNELLSLLGYSAFGRRSQETRQSPLTRLATRAVRLNEAISLCEHHEQGLVPRFTPQGFIKPERVDLILRGHHHDCLTDARSAREYGQALNAGEESTQSLVMAPGTLPRDRVLAELQEGLLINNLWYCNVSDVNDCRITGMTRYANFWVEDGEIAAPIAPMRFDDSLYRMFGEQLMALSSETELLVDPHSYERRATRSARLPGVLVEGFSLTL